MMNVLCSMICFILFLLLGDVLMFINIRFFVLLPWFLIYLFLLKGVYKTANCKALEAKDFLCTLLFTVVSAALLSYLNISMSLHTYAYLYLMSFISLLVYIDDIRFKSLM